MERLVRIVDLLRLSMVESEEETVSDPEADGYLHQNVEGEEVFPEEEEEEEYGWAYLPDMLLSNIFVKLNLRQRQEASRVCTNWNDVFHSSGTWKYLTINPTTFTFLRFNWFQGYQKELRYDHVQKCLGRVGRYIRHLTINPLPDFHNLYEFMNILSTFLNYFDDYPMPVLKRFSFTFACEIRSLTGTVVFGTGGQLLREITRLLGSLKGLTHLTLNQLLLDRKDINGLLDTFIENNKKNLKHLEIMNCTKEPHPLLPILMFGHLQKLIISPPQLNDEIVLSLAEHEHFSDLHIVQDAYTSAVTSLSPRTWRKVKQVSTKLKVRLEVRGITDAEVMIQEEAPVHEIVYRTPYSKVTTPMVLSFIDQYRLSLCKYTHLCLPRKFGSRSFQDRGDSDLVLLIRECPNIQTLVIRERVSTTTLLIIASEAKKLTNFHVRRNGILLKFDWDRAPHWTDEHYNMLKLSSRSYELTETEIRKLLNERKWNMMSDKEFMRFDI